MGWMIGRTAALSNPEAARKKAIEKLRCLAELDDPESVVVPILARRAADGGILSRCSAPDQLPSGADRERRRLASRS